MTTGSRELFRLADSASAQEIEDFYYNQGLTDGLPIIPPTPDLVVALVRASGRRPGDSLGLMPPSNSAATIEKLATNAVMAGCRPEHMRIVLAAVEAMLGEKNNLYGIQGTTNPVHPGFVVNGPAAREAGINSGSGCFGPGKRANMVIGRAIRLILLNVGGAAPGALDMATQGQPGKLSFVFAENEEESPWEPLHVELGYAPTDSTVTTFGAGGITNIIDNTSKLGEEVLLTVAHSMIAAGTNNMSAGNWPVIVLCPEHAQTAASAGFSKRDVKQFLFEHSRVSLDFFPRALQATIAEQRSYLPGFDGTHLSPAQSPEKIVVVVAGGPGKQSSFIQTAVAKEPITRPVR